MTLKTQTDGTSPTLCHRTGTGKTVRANAVARARDGAGGAQRGARNRGDINRGDVDRDGTCRSTVCPLDVKRAHFSRGRMSRGDIDLVEIDRGTDRGDTDRADIDRTGADDNNTIQQDNFPRSARSTTRKAGLRSKHGTVSVGAKFEAHALGFLQRQRLRLVARNVVCRGGEIDLVMRDPSGALVFVEVRARSQTRYGGARASVGWHKRQRIVRAAQYYLAAHPHETAACRFDVIAFEAGRLVWLRDAFRADDV